MLKEEAFVVLLDCSAEGRCYHHLQYSVYCSTLAVFSENWILPVILPVVFLNKYVGAFVWCCGQDSSPSELCFTEEFSKCISKAVFFEVLSNVNVRVCICSRSVSLGSSCQVKISLMAHLVCSLL